MTALVGYMILFAVVAVLFIYVHLMAGKLLRPYKPDVEKRTIYECGEPTIGSAWIQFDVRYYVVALLFVIFDVEVAFFFPWAVVFGQANTLAKADPNDQSPRVQQAKQELLRPNSGKPLTEDQLQEPLTIDQQNAAGQLAWLAFADIAVFFGVLLVGFAYLWKRGDLNWVRSTAAEDTPAAEPPPVEAGAEALVGAGRGS
jgi:NADH-quinone oxidoreductase subunit A